ncbi:hypothetical protein JW992_15860 [candidate division KSB1 bacterium]|nr:hypothetical protein [candidate division KSB1 bacterium]
MPNLPLRIDLSFGPVTSNRSSGLAGTLPDIVQVMLRNEFKPVFSIRVMIVAASMQCDPRLWKSVEEQFVTNNNGFNNYEKLLIARLGR